MPLEGFLGRLTVELERNDVIGAKVSCKLAL